jgi:hypothetical protein
MSTAPWKIYRKPAGKSGVTIEWWYDRHCRVWFTRVVDIDGNQLGESQQSANKAGRNLDIRYYRKLYR